MNVAERLVQYLEDEGVQYIFGVPGEENLALLHAIQHSNLEMVVTRHETGAAFMAGMVGRLTGTPGVCLSTLGPGATNLLTGVANANQDRSPLVAITAQGGLNRHHKESHQMIDLVKLFEPVTKWNTSIRTPDITGEVVRKAFYLARSEKPGATHIELPEDIASMDCPEAGTAPAISPHQTVSTEQNLQQAIQQIDQAKQPLLLCGNGVARAKAEQQVIKLAEKLQAPVTETFMGKGTLPSHHSLHYLPAGMPGRDYIDLAFNHADLLIVIGLDMIEYRPDRWNQKQTPILHIDSQPAEMDAHYPLQGSLIGNLQQNLSRLTEAVAERNTVDPVYIGLKQQMEQEYQLGQEFSYPIKPQQIIAELRSVLQDQDLVISDVGAHKLWIGRLFPTNLPHTCLISNGLAAMGYALPSAIGAKMVNPEKKVVAVVGDGSLQMTGMELETAIRLQLPIVILLWRDGGYGLIEWKQLDEYGESAYIKFNNPDFVMQAQSYGADAFRIENPEQLRPTLLKALAIDKPVLIDCPVDYRENMRLTQRLDSIDIN